MLKVAILDDYQNVSQQFVDIEKLSGKYEIKIFSEPFTDEANAIEQLSDFEALLIMRERTPMSKNLIDNLSKLKFIITSGTRNNSIDLEAAKKKKINGKNSKSGGVTTHLRKAGPRKVEIQVVWTGRRFRAPRPAVLSAFRDPSWLQHLAGLALPGQAGQAWPGLAWLGEAWPSLARPGKAWPGLAWPVLARTGQAWPGLAWPALARLGQA